MNKTVVVFIDALSWAAAERFSFLRWRSATRVPLRTVLGFSSAATATILTGLAPAEHGIWLMYLYRPGSSPFKAAGFLSRVFRPGRGEYRIARPLVRFLAAKRGGIQGYFDLYSIPLSALPQFDLSSRRYPFAPGAFAPSESVFDSLERARGQWVVWDWNVPEDRAFGELLERVKSGPEEFLFLYTPVLDSLMHADGPYAPAVEEKLRWYEAKVTELARLCDSERARLLLFSDHGMQQTRGAIDLRGQVEKLRWEPGRDYVAFYDSSMARFWFFNDAARSEIISVLSSSARGRLLPDEEQKKLGVFFPDRRYGELIFACEPGFLIVPSFMSVDPIRGMHGFLPDHEESSGLFFSPFHSGDPPVEIADLFEIMRESAAVGGGP